MSTVSSPTLGPINPACQQCKHSNTSCLLVHVSQFCIKTACMPSLLLQYAYFEHVHATAFSTDVHCLSAHSGLHASTACAHMSACQDCRTSPPLSAAQLWLGQSVHGPQHSFLTAVRYWQCCTISMSAQHDRAQSGLHGSVLSCNHCVHTPRAR
jgi:hypothetical protein